MPKQNRRQHGEGSLYQRKSDGRWVATVNLGRKPNGKPDVRPFYGATPEEAQRARAKFQADRAEGYTRTPGKAPLLGTWIWRWLEEISGARDNTKQGYRSLIKVWIVPHLGAWRMDALGEAEGVTAVTAMYAAMRRAGKADSTVHKTHAVLRRALNVAVKRRDETKLARNPCLAIEMGTPDQAEIIPPEADEADLILQATAGRRNGTRWSVGLGLGTRQGESLGLTWSMIDLDDLDNATVRIQWELVRLTYKHGCDDPHACGKKLHRWPCPTPCPKAARTSGRQHVCRTPDHPKVCPAGCTAHASKCPARIGGLVLTPPKSKKSRRTVALPRPLAEMLKAHKASQAAERLALGEAWTGWGHDPEKCSRRPRARQVVCPSCRRPFKLGDLVFAQPNGMPVDSRKDWQEWTDLLDELGLPHYRPHDGRHFAATLLLALGVDPRVVQEIIGHDDAAFTQRTYQYVALKMQKDAATLIGNALWKREA